MFVDYMNPVLRGDVEPKHLILFRHAPRVCDTIVRRQVRGYYVNQFKKAKISNADLLVAMSRTRPGICLDLFRLCCLLNFSFIHRNKIQHVFCVYVVPVIAREAIDVVRAVASDNLRNNKTKKLAIALVHRCAIRIPTYRSRTTRASTSRGLWYKNAHQQAKQTKTENEFQCRIRAAETQKTIRIFEAARVLFVHELPSRRKIACATNCCSTTL
jgi:hypothetical protein